MGYCSVPLSRLTLSICLDLDVMDDLVWAGWDRVRDLILSLQERFLRPFLRVEIVHPDGGIGETKVEVQAICLQCMWP